MSDLGVVINSPLTRRAMLRQLLGGAATGAAFPGLGAASPIRHYLRNDALMDQADVQVAADSWQPVFLTTHQSDTLIVLAERIVPNSSKAQVNRIIDLLLSVDASEHQKRFTDSLSAVDSESQQHFGEPFKAMSQARQNELLTLLSTRPSTGSSDTGTGETEKYMRSELFDHFENLKRWVSEVYFTTEMGLRELGWTGDVFFASFPGCQHPEGHS